MSYKINKTNGELLVDLVDGQIDTISTDITLVGRNYKGFGESVNENFIRLLENFARTSAPTSPLVGQLWYDTAEERLKIYTGETFRAASGAIVSQTQPNLTAGDLWIDSFNNKLYFFDGTDIVLVGPQYNAAQGRTSVEAATLIDTTGQDKTVLFMYIGGLLTGIYSRAEFRPAQTITGFPIDPTDTNIPKRQLIKPGFNPVDSKFLWQGAALSTQSLINEGGEVFTEANFMKTDRNTSTLGSISVRNKDGITVGVSDTVYAQWRITNDLVTAIETQQTNKDFALRVKRGNTFDDAVYIDTDLKRVGIYTRTPSIGLDVNSSAKVNGDFTVTGSLTVQGDSLFLNTETLQVEDKNIELATVDGVAAGNDTVADGGGFTLKSTDGDKTFVWIDATDSWTSSEHLDIASGKSYKINGNIVLSANRLDNSILYAEGLISVGTLQELQVDDININEDTITSGVPLNITSGGTITINDKSIAGVATPISARASAAGAGSESDGNDVATKEYVDVEIKAEPVVLTVDTTGFTSPSADFAVSGGPYTDVKGVLDFLYPANQKTEGTIARIFCTSYANATVTGIEIDQLVDDPNNPGGPQISAVDKSFISVDKDNVSSTESVLQDVDFLPVSASAQLQPTRGKMIFEVSGGAWVWNSTTVVT
jgi:hypothetical protein